jgi:peptidoglycan/LPS O-acetylase OafA/YrhL
VSEKKTIEFLPQIDGLRFIAVFGVMIHHWVVQDFSNSFIFKNIPFGTGVNLFFVISGFLITYILLKKKDEIAENKTSFLHEIKNFYVKRTLRIFPIYYLVIILLCIFSYSGIKEYLGYLITYSINWFMVFKGVYIGNRTHLWSLAVEEQFYLIWPFLIFMTPKRWILGLSIFAVLLSLTSKIYFLYFTSYWMGVNGATFSCFDALGLGALIAYLQKTRIQPFKSTLYKLYLLISIVIYVLLFVSPGFLNQELHTLLLNFATAVVFFFVISIAANNGFGGNFKSFLENKTVLYLGRISYGLYLYHAFVPDIYYSCIMRFFPKLTGDADLFVLFFILSVLLASISWYLIEKPILNLKRYFQ